MNTSKAAAALGRKGGKAGTGAAKRRGDSAYYKALRARVNIAYLKVYGPGKHPSNCRCNSCLSVID